MSFELLALPAFSDNYVWLLHDHCDAVVVDPGQASGVREVLVQHPHVRLRSIWITHHHWDHVNAVQELKESYPEVQVYGPGNSPRIAHLIDQGLHDGDEVQAFGCRFQVWQTPGHTLDHLVYFTRGTEQMQPLLLCGDTLFSAGCGRLFEGSPEQMWHSLQRLMSLPDDTRVCCTHEYTLGNLRFAQAVEPGNEAIQKHLRQCETWRAANLPTLPSSIGLERTINPFLRVQEAGVQRSVARYAPQCEVSNPVDVLACLREWKNNF